jgi:hypothetical protein
MALHGHDMDWETEMFAHMAGKVILSHTAKAYWKIKRTLSDLQSSTWEFKPRWSPG